jgi:hypothetical protein
MGQQAHFDPPVSEPNMDVEVAPTVPDAQSAPNEIVGDCWYKHIEKIYIRKATDIILL